MGIELHVWDKDTMEGTIITPYPDLDTAEAAYLISKQDETKVSTVMADFHEGGKVTYLNSQTNDESSKLRYNELIQS